MQIEMQHPFDLLHGLIDSAGSRFDRKVDGRIYPAYEFSNESADIRDIFCRVARAVGLVFTAPKPNVIAVARRQHVARLDLHLPPKDRDWETLG